MPDWLIWFIAFWAIVGCGTGCRRMWGHRRLRAGAAPGAGELSSGGSASEAAASPATDPQSIPGGGEAAGAVSTPAVADSGMRADDTVLGALQRRFVEGKISLEQYEAELDRLDHKELN